MALIVLRILILLLPLGLFLFWLKRRRSGGRIQARELVPIALVVLATIVLLIITIRITEPTELPERDLQSAVPIVSGPE